MLLVLLLRRREFDGVIDSSCSRAGRRGVRLVENILTWTARWRMAASPPGWCSCCADVTRCAHPLFTGAIGIGVGIAARNRRPWVAGVGHRCGLRRRGVPARGVELVGVLGPERLHQRVRAVAGSGVRVVRRSRPPGPPSRGTVDPEEPDGLPQHRLARRGRGWHARLTGCAAPGARVGTGCGGPSAGTRCAASRTLAASLPSCASAWSAVPPVPGPGTRSLQDPHRDDRPAPGLHGTGSANNSVGQARRVSTSTSRVETGCFVH